MIFEKIRERLQKANQGVCHFCGCDLYSDDAIDIINQVEAEYKYINIITDYLQYVRDNADNYDTENGWTLADLIDLSIKFSEVAEYNNGWIPCSERLPEDANDYLVTQYNQDAINEYCNGYRVATIFFDDKGWWDDIDNDWGWNIIAWQPLPQPPKGE